MRKLNSREVARLLAARPTPEPPAGFSDRIKSEIPGSIHVGRGVFQPGRRWLMPPLVEGLHPSWIAAASLLLVLGVGFVAAHIPARPDDVWKWIALNGVVHIDDVVVTAPAPRDAGTSIALASAETRDTRAARRHRGGPADRRDQPGSAGTEGALRVAPGDAARPPIPAEAETARGAAGDSMGALDLTVTDGARPLSGATVVVSRAEASEGGGRMAVSDLAGRASVSDLPAGEYRVRSESPGFQPLETTVDVAGGATARLDVTLPPDRVAEALTAPAAREPAPAQPAAASALRRPVATAPAGPPASESAVVVVVLDQAGNPCEGVVVTLERLGQGATWERSGRTDADGVAAFRGVPPSTYRTLVTAPSIAPAQRLVNVTSDRAPTRAEVRVRALPPR